MNDAQTPRDPRLFSWAGLAGGLAVGLLVCGIGLLTGGLLGLDLLRPVRIRGGGTIRVDAAASAWLLVTLCIAVAAGAWTSRRLAAPEL